MPSRNPGLLRVLIVDDDPVVRLIATSALQREGHEVLEAETHDRALTLAREQAPDVVVLDIRLPELSGFEILADLRSHKETATIPILMLSAQSDGSSRVRGLREGADDFLGKPFEIEELLLRVANLARRSSRAAGHHQDPNRLGRYELRGLLGSGAMGRVYRGWDPELRRDVALKTIRLDQEIGRRIAHDHQLLLSEAATAAKINHPHVVAIYDVGEQRRLLYVAMELVDGISLKDLIQRRGRLEVPAILALGQAIASALAAAHSRDIVHQDVKPANILLGRNRKIKLVDFGIASAATAASSNQVWGTPGFLSPEALTGRAICTPHRDLFALGAVLYTCLCGTRPFEAETLEAIVEKTLNDVPRPLQELAPDTPEPLTNLVHDLLAHDPEDRPPSAGAVVDLLRAIGPAHWEPLAASDRPTDDPGPGSTLIAAKTHPKILGPEAGEATGSPVPEEG